MEAPSEASAELVRTHGEACGYNNLYRGATQVNVTGDAQMIPKESSELDDAAQTIAAAGLNPDHFDVEVSRLDLAAGPNYAVRYAVTIFNRDSGRRITLSGGHGENWVDRLRLILSAGELR